MCIANANELYTEYDYGMEKFSIPYPVKPWKLSQGFGVNGEYYRKNGINIKGHNGLDLQAYTGQPCYAVHDGYAYHQVDGSSGCGITVISDKEYEFRGKPVRFKTIFWHLVDYAKKPQFKSPVLDWQQKNKGKPKSVKKGELIGYCNNTGLSTGPHLHFSVKPIVQGKPVDAWMDSADIGIGQWQNVTQTEGYLGSIDPTPYFNGKYADDLDPVIEEAGKIVKAIEDIGKVNPPGKDYIDTIVEWMWSRFLALFIPKK